MEHHASLVTWQQIGKKTGAEVKVHPHHRTGPPGHGRRARTDHRRHRDGQRRSRLQHARYGEPGRGDHRHRPRYTTHCRSSTAPSPFRPAPSTSKEIDCDFLAFSGHKMCGPTGSGALYGKEEVLEAMEPYLYGGDMITKVTYEDSTWNELPGSSRPGRPPSARASRSPPPSTTSKRSGWIGSAATRRPWPSTPTTA